MNERVKEVDEILDDIYVLQQKYLRFIQTTKRIGGEWN